MNLNNFQNAKYKKVVKAIVTLLKHKYEFTLVGDEYLADDKDEQNILKDIGELLKNYSGDDLLEMARNKKIDNLL